MAMAIAISTAYLDICKSVEFILASSCFASSSISLTDSQSIFDTQWGFKKKPPLKVCPVHNQVLMVNHM